MILLPILTTILLASLIIFTIYSLISVINEGFLDNFYTGLMFAFVILCELLPIIFMWLVYFL